MLAKEILEEGHLEALLDGKDLFSLLPPSRVADACKVIEQVLGDEYFHMGYLPIWERYDIIRESADYVLFFRPGEGDILLLTWKFPYEALLEALRDELVYPSEVFFLCPGERRKVLEALGLNVPPEEKGADLLDMPRREGAALGEEGRFAEDYSPGEDPSSFPLAQEEEERKDSLEVPSLEVPSDSLELPSTSPSEGAPSSKEPISPFADGFIASIDELPPIDPSLARVLPKEISKRFRILVLGKGENNRILAISPNPHNLLARDSVEILFKGHRVHVYGVPESLFQAVYFQVYEDKPLLVQMEEKEEAPSEPVDVGVEESEAQKFVYRMVREALFMDASDIHLEPQKEGARIRFRVDGTLREWGWVPRSQYPSVVSVIKILSGMDIGEKRLPQDGRFRLRLELSQAADFRVSSVPLPYGERVVMRLLKKASDIPEIEGLGFLEDTLKAFEGIISKPYGLFLVTGPTGSGKSFTLFSALKRLVSPERNILTVEDPIEYEIPGISQVQVNSKIGLTFARALRSFLRQDPDVIMVGEIRDTETAKIAIEAALTGHLVLATLHTNDAPQAVTRLEAMGVERYNVAASLLGVLSQRLVRRLCGCKKPSPAKEVGFYLRLFEETGLEVPEEPTFYEPNGCRSCGSSGFKGRLPLHELMVVSDGLREAIMEGVSSAELRGLAIKEGMRTLRADGLVKASRGLTTVQEVLQKTLD